MSEKYDFSKIEEQQKFEQLPPEEKEAVISAAQEEVASGGTKDYIEMTEKENKEAMEKIVDIYNTSKLKYKNINGIINLQKILLVGFKSVISESVISAVLQGEGVQEARKEGAHAPIRHPQPLALARVG